MQLYIMQTLKEVKIILLDNVSQYVCLFPFACLTLLCYMRGLEADNRCFVLNLKKKVKSFTINCNVICSFFFFKIVIY